MDSKAAQYAAQSARARADMLLNWPLWQRRNANDPRRRFRDAGRTHQEHVLDSIEIVLDLARGRDKHTPLGHDCVECEAMMVLVEVLIQGE